MTSLTVDEAKKVLKLAEEVDGHAEIGPWRSPLDVFDPEDAAAIVLWRAAFGGLLLLADDAIHMAAEMTLDQTDSVLHPAHAKALVPLIAWADANHKGWRDAEPGKEEVGK